MLNFDSKTFDDLAARIGKAIEDNPAKDIEKNVKALLQGGLARLDVVTRTDSKTQAAVLLEDAREAGASGSARGQARSAIRGTASDALMRV